MTFDNGLVFVACLYSNNYCCSHLPRIKHPETSQIDSLVGCPSTNHICTKEAPGSLDDLRAQVIYHHYSYFNIFTSISAQSSGVHCGRD